MRYQFTNSVRLGLVERLEEAARKIDFDRSPDNKGTDSIDSEFEIRQAKDLLMRLQQNQVEACPMPPMIFEDPLFTRLQVRTNPIAVGTMTQLSSGGKAIEPCPMPTMNFEPLPPIAEPDRQIPSNGSKAKPVAPCPMPTMKF